MDDPKQVAAFFKAEGRTSKPFGLHDLPDDSLIRVRRAYLREIEDGAEPRKAKKLAAAALHIRQQQLARFRLRMRYGALDDHLGTHSYDRWYRHGDAPSYRLAAAMDQMRAYMGKSHVLAWPKQGDSRG